MEQKRRLKRTDYQHIILVIVLVCAVLILAEIWANVGPLVPHPWEGPTPTATLWWRTPKASSYDAPIQSTQPVISINIPLATSEPGSQPGMEANDG